MTEGSHGQVADDVEETHHGGGETISITGRARSGRARAMTETKQGDMRRLTQFIRRRRRALRLTQQDLFERAHAHPIFGDDVSLSYIIRIENFAELARAADTGFYHIRAVLAALGANLTELEAFLGEPGSESSSPAETERQVVRELERDLLALFRSMHPIYQLELIRVARMFAHASTGQYMTREDVEEAERAAALDHALSFMREQVTIAEREHSKLSRERSGEQDVENKGA